MWCGTRARRTEGIGTILLQVIKTGQHPLASGGTQQRQPGVEELLEAKVQWQAKIEELMEAKVQWRHHQV